LDTNPTDGVFFMAKFAERLKLEIVRKYLAGAGGTEVLAQQYGVGRTSLRGWISRYREHGEAGLRRKYGRYSAQFKLSVLRRMKDEDLSQTQAVALFDLRGGTGVVAKWQRQYDEGGPEALKPKPQGRPPNTMPTPKPPKAPPPPADDASTLEKLRKENEYLRAEVAYLKKLEALVRAKRQAAQKERKPSSS
jgi:transposase